MMDMLTGGKISQKVKDNMISHVSYYYAESIVIKLIT